MKKLLLLLSLLTISFTYAVAANTMNPFAYDLSASLNQETMTLTVKYTLNAPASSIKVRIFNGNTEEKSYISTRVEDRTKGPHAIDIDVSDCPSNVNLTWCVDVEGISHNDALLISNSNKLYYPTSIDIDNNPQNANFGTVFCIEGRDNAINESGYISSVNKDGAGLYIFNADGTKRALPHVSKEGFGVDVERYGWNGGKSLSSKAETNQENINYNQNNFYFGANRTKRGFAPYRVRVSKDGRIFITMMTPNGDVLYEANKNVFSDETGEYWNSRTWSRVISSQNGPTLTDNKILTTGGNFVAGPNVGFDVRNSGNNLQLLMLSCTKKAIIGEDYSFRCDEYNLNQATTWNSTPSKSVFTGEVVIHNASQVLYDKNGNVYMSQLNYPKAVPTLKKYCTNGQTEEINRTLHRCGAMRFNKDFTKFAVTTEGPNQIGGEITIYDVNANGDVNWNSFVKLNVSSTVGLSMMDFAWDYADNLYIAADKVDGESAGQCIAIYAMPNKNKNIVSTPARTGFEIECVRGATYSINATSNNSEWGIVTLNCSEELVSGKVPSCAIVTVTATPKEHYRFVEWKVGDQTVSTDPIYSFYAKNNLTVTAHFEHAIHNVTWNNLFMNGKDIGTENPHYPNINERLWRMFQARYKNSHPGDAGYTYSYLNDVFNLDSRKYVRTDNLLLVDINNEEAVKNSKDVGNFITSDPTFEWLGTYLKSHSTASWNTDKAWVYHLFAFFNKSNKIYYNTETAVTTYDLKCDYSKWGQPENWAPVWTEAVLGLPQTMEYGEYTPIDWNWESEDQLLFRGKWVNGWKDTSTDPETGEAYVQRPDAWYAFNTLINRASNRTDVWGLGHTFLSNTTHILAWRKDGIEGDIVTIIDGNMALYATYVEKNIDEYDVVPANPANYDATNNDVIKLLLNPKYSDGSHDVTISRQLQGGMYNTICLPFDVDLTSLANNHPFKGAKAMEFTGVSSLYNESNEPVTVLQFTEVTSLEKGVPYLIQTQSDVVGKTSFSGITYNTITPNVQQVTPNESPFTFHGSVNPTEVPEGSLIVVANNRLALTTEGGEMAGMRGYFSIDPVYASEIAEQAAAGRVYLKFQKPTTTSIPGAPEAEQQSQPQVYKLLQDGNIYIIRGNEKYTITGNRVR
ncbi:MAG: hypothetical protein IKY49_02435 [Paludibacteraceae bacterium]|nr:hypothetical protein [Paludibacteraceae bacterium]